MDDGHRTIELRAEGVFDPPAARELARRVSEADALATLVIDMAGATRCDACALALLASAVGTRTAAVSVRGLRRHDRRVLEYLGLASDDLVPALPDTERD